MPTPIQAAKRANVSVQSIRNWTRDYADLLSPSARGEAGPRLFTDEDVEILCTIAALRKSGVSPSEVAERIRSGAPSPIIEIEPPQPTESPQEPINAPLAEYLAYNGLQSRLEAVERRIEARNSEFVTGVIVGAMVVLVVVALVLRMV